MGDTRDQVSPPSQRAAKPSANDDRQNAQHRCSYCGTDFIRRESRFMPFCSKRCQQIDLGMWFNESYGMPVEGDESTPLRDAYDSDDED